MTGLQATDADPREPTIGLAEEGPAPVLARVTRSWAAFLAAAQSADPDAPTRLAGWRVRDVVAHLGAWEDHHPLEATVRSAVTGDLTGAPDQDEVDARLRRLHADRSREELLASVEAARDRTLRWLRSQDATAYGRRRAATIVGPLPLLTSVQCLCFELAVHTMDLEPAGGGTAPSEAVADGLAAICDATAGVAYREGSFARVTVQTPGGGWRMSIGEEGWRTEHRPPGTLAEMGVSGSARDLLDIAAGRANVPRLYSTGKVRIVDLPGFLELAPLIDYMPGIPNRAALKAAATRMGAISRLLSRRRGPGRTGG